MKQQEESGCQQEWWNSLRFHHPGSYSRICDRCGTTFEGDDVQYHFKRICVEKVQSSAMSAWFVFNNQCEKIGIVPGIYTAFMEGYKSRHNDAKGL